MLSEIENICDKVMFIDKGKLIGIKDVKHNKKIYKFVVDDEDVTNKIIYPYKTNNSLEIEATKEEYLRKQFQHLGNRDEKVPEPSKYCSKL